MILVIILFGISLALFFYFDKKRIARLNEYRRRRKENLLHLVEILKKKSNAPDKNQAKSKKTREPGTSKKK